VSTVADGRMQLPTHDLNRLGARPRSQIPILVASYPSGPNAITLGLGRFVMLRAVNKNADAGNTGAEAKRHVAVTIRRYHLKGGVPFPHRGELE
jgi:hypothetical protein